MIEFNFSSNFYTKKCLQTQIKNQERNWKLSKWNRVDYKHGDEWSPFPRRNRKIDYHKRFQKPLDKSHIFFFKQQNYKKLWKSQLVQPRTFGGNFLRNTSVKTCHQIILTSKLVYKSVWTSIYSYINRHASKNSKHTS